MSELVRAAIVGTGQLPPTAAEQTGTAVDALIDQLSGLERERALLLRAGGLALLRRSARDVSSLDGGPEPALEPAAAETLRAPSTRLTELLRSILADTNDALLSETLVRMAHAGMRLAEELLPTALARPGASVRERMRPVLGARGLWLARLRPEWAWALSAAPSAGALPVDSEARWEEASAAERKSLLASARRENPGLARKLVGDSWKQEKAEQRLAWLEILAADLTFDDEPLLTQALSDRSSQVRGSAARLLWGLADSELACRVRARVDALTSFKAPAGGVFAKLKALAGADARGSWQLVLPPEELDSAWEKDGIVETAPQGIGRRQWWLAQLLSAVSPDHWVTRFEVSPEVLVAAALEHELADVLLDGLTSAALRHDAARWFAPLWDAWSVSKARAFVSYSPLQALSARLPLEQAEPRMVTLLESDQPGLLDSFAQPWPRPVAQLFLRALSSYRPALTELLGVAAMAIPAELLPADLATPEVPDNDYAAQAYLRAFERFRSIASVRRALAEEIAS